MNDTKQTHVRDVIVHQRWLTSQCGGCTLVTDYGVNTEARAEKLADNIQTMFNKRLTGCVVEASDAKVPPEGAFVREVAAPKGYALAGVHTPAFAQRVTNHLLAGPSNGKGEWEITACDEDVYYTESSWEPCGECGNCDDGWYDDCVYKEDFAEAPTLFEKSGNSFAEWSWLEGSSVIVGVMDFCEVESHVHVVDALTETTRLWDGTDFTDDPNCPTTVSMLEAKAMEGCELDSPKFRGLLEPYGDEAVLYRSFHNVTHVDLNERMGHDEYQCGIPVTMPCDIKMTFHSATNGRGSSVFEKGTTYGRAFGLASWYMDTEITTPLSLMLALIFAGNGSDEKPIADVEDGWWFLSSNTKLGRHAECHATRSEFSVSTELVIHWFRHYPELMTKALNDAGFRVDEIRTFKPTRNGNEGFHLLDAVAIRGGWDV